MTDHETAVLNLIAERQVDDRWHRITPEMLHGPNPTQEQEHVFRLALANVELRGLIQRSAPAGGRLTHARLTDHGQRWIEVERSESGQVPILEGGRP